MKAKFKAYLASINEEEKALTLSRLINNLTICGRAQYGEEGAEERLRTINEMMHLTSGKLRDVLMRTSKQYPDDVFIDILFEIARAREGDLNWAVSLALEPAQV